MNSTFLLYSGLQGFDGFPVRGYLPMQGGILPLQCLDLVTAEKKTDAPSDVGGCGGRRPFQLLRLLLPFPALAFSLDDGNEREVYMRRFLIPMQVRRHDVLFPERVGEVFQIVGPPLVQTPEARPVFTSQNRRGTSILRLNCLISPSTVRRHIKGRLPLGFSLPSSRKIRPCPNHRYNNKYQHDTCQSCFGPQIPQGHAAYGAVVFGYPGIIPLLPDYRATKDRCGEYQE